MHFTVVRLPRLKRATLDIEHGFIDRQPSAINIVARVH